MLRSHIRRLRGQRRWLPTLLGVSGRALLERDSWQSVVVHEPRYATAPIDLVLHLTCRSIRGQLRCPDNLTIALVHNHTDRQLMASSLRYAGIDRFTELRPAFEGAWRYTLKITTLLDYLESGRCPTDYLLYADNRDVFLRADPQAALDLLQAQQCEALFSTESHAHGYDRMPEVFSWASERAAEAGHPGRYLNAGVFIGRVDFLIDLFRAAMAYIGTRDLPGATLRRHLLAGTLDLVLPDFPRHAGSDQLILRWLQPRFYPRLKLDYAQQLAARQE